MSFLWLLYLFLQIFGVCGLLILEFHNILPFKSKYFQPLRNLLWITKYILEIIIHLMYLGKALLFSTFQMGFPSVFVATPLWGKCEVATHTPENGTWESFETPENSEVDFRGQNTSPWSILYTVEKVLKCRCPKWPRMNHLDICSTSYGRKKGRESNWQFDSRPLKVGNRLDSDVCRWSATHCWKALEESYKFASDLIPIGGLSKKLWTSKVPRVQIGTVSGLHFGSPGKKSHLDVGAAE